MQYPSPPTHAMLGPGMEGEGEGGGLGPWTEVGTRGIGDILKESPLVRVGRGWAGNVGNYPVWKLVERPEDIDDQFIKVYSQIQFITPNSKRIVRKGRTRAVTSLNHQLRKLGCLQGAPVWPVGIEKHQ